MKAAEAELVAALHADYRVTKLEVTGVAQTVTVEEWKQNRRDHDDGTR